jgi:methylmalonyl-CoA mutase
LGPEIRSVVPLALRASREFPLVRALVVDGLPVHVAGGSDAQELGYLLSAGWPTCALTAAGIGVDAAARLLELRLAATAGSSRRSRSCARRAACGRACWR